MDEVKQVACGVPWCVGVAGEGRQYCTVHEDQRTRSQFPPPVSRELEQRYFAERNASKTNAPLR